LNGSKIHRLENVMTLDMTMHSFFDSLDLYLEKTVSGYSQECTGNLTAATVDSQQIQTNFPPCGLITSAS
jgi:hypothetical protein